MRARFRFHDLGVQDFDLPDARSELPPVVFVGVKKGGSTLLAKIIRDLSEHSAYELFELPKECFRRGLPFYKCIEDVDHVLSQAGYAFGTFRWLPENWLFDLHGPKPPRSLLLVRDPRDMLVSLYFSDAKSHTMPDSGPLRDGMLKRRAELTDGQLPIDDYVRDQAPKMLRNFYRTLQLQTIPECRVTRYEDIIYSKLALVESVAELLRVDTTDRELIESTAARHDVVPDESRPDAHIRQVHPGNHRKVLEPSTVDYLTDTFDVVLESLGYDE